MTFYEKEINRIRKLCYSNQGQLDTVIGIRNYIDNNYEKEINLDLLSHIRFTSKFHLLRLFRRYYGLTPKQYSIDKRILEAKKHLSNGMNVTEACFLVGYESPGSFSTLFTNRTGQTPTDFQKEQLSSR